MMALVLRKRNHDIHGFSFLFRKEKNMYQQNGNILIIYVPKELDHHKAEEMKKETLHIFQKATIRYVIFDFKETEFMDSSGIAVVINTLRVMAKMDGFLELAGVNPQPMKVFKASGIDKLVKMKEEV